MAMKFKKTSLWMKLALTMLLLSLFTVVFSWIANTVFLESYYSKSKQKQMVEAFDSINKASQKNLISSDSFDVAFDKLCNNYNLNIIIFDESMSVKRASASDMERLSMEFVQLMKDLESEEYSEVEESDNFLLTRQTDSRLNDEYLTLFGKLEGGDLIYMRTAIESIKESAEITNLFIRKIGILSVIISAIVVFFVSKSITRPVKKLVNISAQMTNLDFDAKYDGKGGSREIDELGGNINNLSESLENTISELKAANNELMVDIQKKEQIDEMRKEFLSNVSHELKTPIALIQGYAEGLKEGINDDEESRNFYCEVIMDEADKMNKMVMKLLTLNHLEFGNDKVEMVRFDLAELVDGVIAASSLLAEQNGISITFDKDMPMNVWADEFMIEEVVTNYLSNAIHYAEGEKKIQITARKNEGKIRLSVFNTGKQIPEEELDKVWIKFYKVDKARTREYGGSGIGLSIVKAIMDSHHQACGVQNHPDGVEFWMELDANI